MKKTKLAIFAGAAFGLIMATPASASTFIAANSLTPVLIGNVVVGDSYTISASGIADLCATCNNDGPLPFTADGKPTYAYMGTYAAFYPNGLDYDPSVGTTAYGLGGSGHLLGALLGTYTAAPTYGNTAQFFTIGLGETFTATVSSPIYAVINDTDYPDNVAGYTVSFSSVPEATTWAMALLGFGLVGSALRARRKHSVRVTYA